MCIYFWKTFSLVSKSSVKVRYQGQNFQTMAVAQTHPISLTVLGENLWYCCSLSIVVQKLTFCNISVITQDIYLKSGVCIHYRGKQSKMYLFSELCSFFDLDFSSTIKHPQPSVGTPMHPHEFFFFIKISDGLKNVNGGMPLNPLV